jgi:hypothetical protein
MNAATVNATNPTTVSRDGRGPYLSLEEAAALEGKSYAGYVKHLGRKKLFLARSSADRRRKLVPFTALSPAAQDKWTGQQVGPPTSQDAHEARPSSSLPSNPTRSHGKDARISAPLQRGLTLAPDPPGPESLCIPEKHFHLVKTKLRVVGQLLLKTWERPHADLFGGQTFDSERQFIQWVSRQEGRGFLPSAIYAMKRIALEILRDPLIAQDAKWREIARCLAPRARPGQSGLGYFPGPRSPLFEDLKRLFRGEGGGSIKRTHELFRERFPQDDGGPTLRQVRTALEKLSFLDMVRGHEAVKAAAGYIDRHYDDELAGDAWCIDEWEIDGCFYDEENHARVINYGRACPVAHILSVIDERTTCILAYAVTWKISLEEATLDLTEHLVRTYWAPHRLVADRAGRFRRLSRGRVTLGSDGELIELLAGPLGELGVKLRGSKEKNPRANRIERFPHREYARRAQEFGISWRGANTRERQLTDIDARVARHLKEHCKLGTCGPQILSIQEVQKIVGTWVNDLNSCKTKAKGCKGTTRLAAFNWFRPTQEEIARRKYSDAAVDMAFAERATRTIQAGGVIQLSDGKRYGLPGELSPWTGENVSITRFRRDHSSIEVSVPGQEAQVVAHQRRAVGVNEPEALSEEIAHLEHAQKAIEKSVQTEGLGPRPDQELSSVEYLMSRNKAHIERHAAMFNDDAAAAVLAAMKEEEDGQNPA